MIREDGCSTSDESDPPGISRDSVFYGPITSCGCEECTHISEELRHKRWDEISPAFLNFTCSPTLLTPKAFNAFLPAYLLLALNGFSRHSVAGDFTVYSLCPNDGDDNGQQHLGWIVQRAQLMSPAQIQVIRAFLTFVQENAGSGEWFRRFITNILEKVWR
jgi:hypothetical protein